MFGRASVVRLFSIYLFLTFRLFFFRELRGKEGGIPNAHGRTMKTVFVACGEPRNLSTTAQISERSLKLLLLSPRLGWHQGQVAHSPSVSD